MNTQEQIETIGLRIKKLRIEKGETQTELGNAIGLSQDSISKIENAKSTLTLEGLLNIAEHYHVSTDYLCTGADNLTLLETLTKYISLKYINRFSGHGTFEFPILEIHNGFFAYLVKSAFIYHNPHHMPHDICDAWLEKETENLYKSIKKENSSKSESLVPLPIKFIEPNDQMNEWKQSDLIREVTKHFSTSTKDSTPSK